MSSSSKNDFCHEISQATLARLDELGVPPTPEKVRAFLAETDDASDRVIGTLQPAGRAATVRNVAVYGVMAGCRPDYMPVLIAIAVTLVVAFIVLLVFFLKKRRRRDAVKKFSERV